MQLRHCRVALAQCGFDFDFVETDYAMSAKMSPTWKVPFFDDGDIRLSDSSAIVRYIREKGGQSFLPEILDLDIYSMVNTVLDSTVNIFLIDNDGFGPDQIPYLGRQQNRVNSGIRELNDRIDIAKGITNDANLRLACYIDWAIFRNRVSFEGYGNLNNLIANANRDTVFADTAPPKQ